MTFSENIDHFYSHETGEWHSYEVEERTFYPKVSKRRKPDWFNWQFQLTHDEISAILSEIYSALDHDIVRLAATGVRTAFDCISGKLGIDTSLPFVDKIEEMRKGQHITGCERDYLQILVDAGNAAAHRGWKPDAAGMSTLIEILEGTIHRTLILPSKVKDLQAAVPPKG